MPPGLTQTRPSPFPSAACEAEYNKLLALYKSGELHKMPPGLAGKELREHLNELEDRIYG